MDYAIELADGRLVCRRHGLTICRACNINYSFTEGVLTNFNERIGIETHGLFGQQSPEIHTCSAPAHLYQDMSQPNAGPDDPTVCRRGTGRVLPSTFMPPSPTSTPDELFLAGVNGRAIPPVTRFICRHYPGQTLILTAGACISNGRSNAKAGWAFAFKPPTAHDTGTVSSRLEHKGPFGDDQGQTTNRAELRAVLAALRFRH